MKLETIGTVTRHEHLVRFTVSDVPTVVNRTGAEYAVTGGRVQWAWTDSAEGYTSRQVKLITRRVLKSGRVDNHDVVHPLASSDLMPQWLTELVDAHTPAEYAIACTKSRTGR